MADEFENGLLSLLGNLRRYAISLCRSADIADELVQITCEKAIANRQSFDPATRLDAWLFRILKNSWIDMIRKKRTMGTQIEIDNAPTALVTDGNATTEAGLRQSARPLNCCRKTSARYCCSFALRSSPTRRLQMSLMSR